MHSFLAQNLIVALNMYSAKTIIKEVLKFEQTSLKINDLKTDPNIVIMILTCCSFGLTNLID